jgi:hypothetical protein
MPNEAPIQGNKIETQETLQVSNEPKTDNLYSVYFSNPEVAKKIQDQVNNYKKEKPEIEEQFLKYLQTNTNILRIKNISLAKSLNDEEKIKTQINALIESSIEKSIYVWKEEPKEEPKEIQVKNNEQLIVKEQIKIEKKDVLTEKVEKLTKNIEEVESARQTLIAQNPKLDIKPNSPQYIEVSKKLEASGALKTLAEKGLSAENIDKFISFKATQEAIKTDPSIQNTESFLLSFKKLENELNLPDSSREDFSSKNIEQTSTQLFNPEIGNQNLIDTVSEQKKAHAWDFEKLFDEPKDIGALNDVYGKFLPESQKTYKIIQDKQEKKSKLSQEDEVFLKTFKTDLEIKKTEFESKTTESMEQSTILGPIMGLANYMDMGIGNTFEFNKSNDIQIENGTLSITGNIDNKPFTLETNLDKPSKLKTSDYLNKSDDSNMWVANQNRQETAYIMPGQKEIRENIKENFWKTHQDILKNAKSINEYQETLKKTLCENVQKLYGFKDLVQIRIEKQMTKNIAAQETLDMLNTTILNGKYDYDKNINKNLNPELHNFLSDLDYSLENLSSDEIDSRRQSVKELGKVLDSNQEGKQKNSCKILQDLSPSLLNKTKEIIERKPSTEGQKNTSLFTFFECLKDPQSKTYRVDEFKKLLEENSNPKPNDENYKKTLENRNQKTADDSLDLSLFISIEETTIEYSSIS